MNLNEVQFGHYQPAGTGKYHGIHAVHEGQVIGYMEWAAKRGKYGPAGEITALRVRPDMRGQHVATEMFRHSQGFEQPAEHSTKRTPEGTAFAKSTGTKVPRLMKPLSSEAVLFGPDGDPEASRRIAMQMPEPRNDYHWLNDRRE